LEIEVILNLLNRRGAFGGGFTCQRAVGVIAVLNYSVSFAPGKRGKLRILRVGLRKPVERLGADEEDSNLRENQMTNTQNCAGKYHLPSCQWIL
jgi:hypothetical protein